MKAQETIQALLDEWTSTGAERGAQVAVYHRGRLIVDAWSGIADVRSGRPVDGGTLFPVYSVSKAMAATIVHRLVGRGRLSYDQPISGVWPEFAAHGKERITLRQALNHSAGLPNVPRRVGLAEIADWNAMCAAVADLTPVFPPGSRAEYHAITFGWIVGEPACRAAGRSFSQLLKEEIADPLGRDGLFIGLPAEEASRVAFLEEAAPADPDAPAPIPGWLGPLHDFMNRPEMQRACLPASSGVMNARSIARHYAALLPGGIDGVELLPPSRIREATQAQGLKLADGNPSPWALGYNRYENWSLPGGEWTAFGHGGHGGSFGFADPGRGLAVAFTKNLLSYGNTADRLVQALFAVLD
jgi:CubicO group peptidase (beta-lactamase class C family)